MGRQKISSRQKESILVTGGTGFIAGHLVTSLVNLGYQIIVVDIEVKSRSTFVTNQLHRKVKFELVDHRHRQNVFEIVLTYRPSHIFHLAAQAIVGSAYESPSEAFETNVMGTVNILEAARQNPFVKGIIVASSDKAYGKLVKGKYTEEDALKGDHPYDVSKSAADLISLAYHKTYGLPVVVTRFGNVYGEGDLHFDRIIPGICESIIKKKTLEIRSNGKYVRDYLYVEDVVDGYLFLMKHLNTIKGEAFNFSSNDRYSVLDLIKKVESILNVKIKYSILNTAKNEIPYQQLDDSKIRRLGWKTTHSLKDVLPKVLAWYDQIL